jgi:Protein of unknown function (DUF5818)
MPNLTKHRLHKSVSALFLAAALVSSVCVAQTSNPQAPGVEPQTRSQDQPAISTFSGKILLQNGERFILRDDANEVWFHLDDQQDARKFLGKNVSVTGVLDPLTDTIRVSSIVEANA